MRGRIRMRIGALSGAALLCVALGGCGRSDDTADQPGISADEQQRLDDVANALDTNQSAQPENGS